MNTPLGDTIAELERKVGLAPPTLAEQLELAKSENARKSAELVLLQRRVAALEAQPAPAKARITVMEKSSATGANGGSSGGGMAGGDDLVDRLAALSPDELNLLVTKAAMRRPVPVVR